MKHRIAHIINVTELDDTKKPSYLHIAQPVTMQTMAVAQRAAAQVVDVELFAIKHKNEKIDVPPQFKLAKDIDKYAWEYIEPLRDVTPRKPLPRIVDILNGLYEASDAEYFIYTNVDIGLYPDFYLHVSNLIERGLDAFCINRRTIEKVYGGIIIDENNFELCYLQNGRLHGGVDCFIFRRSILPYLQLNHVFIGFPPVGKILRSQIQIHSRNFQMREYDRVTFHLGNDAAWKNKQHPYWLVNIHQAEGIPVVKQKRSFSLRIQKYQYWLSRRFEKNRNDDSPKPGAR